MKEDHGIAQGDILFDGEKKSGEKSGKDGMNFVLRTLPRKCMAPLKADKCLNVQTVLSKVARAGVYSQTRVTHVRAYFFSDSKKKKLVNKIRGTNALR